MVDGILLADTGKAVADCRVLALPVGALQAVVGQAGGELIGHRGALALAVTERAWFELLVGGPLARGVRHAPDTRPLPAAMPGRPGQVRPRRVPRLQAVIQREPRLLAQRAQQRLFRLLGLMVHLDEVFLEITAEAAPGNLLGNLLCAIAHLLDTNAALNAIVALLNQLIMILG
jgi:hypothetical protein